MTGFGKAECTIGDKKLTIEVKSVNSKQLDLNLRIPYFLKEKDAEVKSMISKSVERGKVDFSVYYETIGEQKVQVFDNALIKLYYKELKKVADELKIQNTNLLAEVLKMPDVLIKSEVSELTEKDWKTIHAAMNKALKAFNDFREQEGKALEKDFNLRLKHIHTMLKKIDGADKERIKIIKDRIRKNIDEVIEPSKFDANRFEQELIYYVEKLDITEEKVRLKNHCDYFSKTMNEEDNAGRKLGFISQEIGREINTIGSKANNAEIQKMVVEMKDDLEKIKEQVNNVL